MMKLVAWRWAAVAIVLAAVSTARSEAALTITRGLTQTATAQDASAVAKGFAAYDPVNRVYLMTWSNFKSWTYGQFISKTGTAIGAPFKVSPLQGGYSRVVYGADGFLVTYSRTGTPQRWGRFVTYSNGAPSMSAESYLYTAYVGDSDSGMTYVPTSKQYLLVYWRYVNGISQSFLVGLKGRLVNIPETRISTNGNGYSQDGPEIACDPARDRCLIVGKAWKDPVSSNPGGAWARVVTASTGVPSGGLFYLDFVLGRKEDQRVAFSPASSRFVVTWVRSRAQIVARRVFADLTMDATFYPVITGGYGQQSLAYNAGSDSFAAAFKDASSPAQHFATELNGAGAVSGAPLRLSTIGTTVDGYPLLVANPADKQFLAMHVVNEKAIYTGIVSATPPVGSGGGGGGGTTAPDLTAVSPNVASPVAQNTAVTWSANVAGGSGVLYKFLLFDAYLNTWTTLADYSSNSSVTWTPTQPGTYNVQVWVKNGSSGAVFDDWLNSDNFVVESNRVVSAALASSVTFPKPAGTTVTWTAGARGGRGPVQYAFYVYDGNVGSFSLVRAYGASNQFSWTPLKPGNYHVQVWVRGATSNEAYEAWAGSAPLTVSPGTVKVVSFGGDRLVPVAPAQPVIWTIDAAGGTTPLEYKFLLYHEGTNSWSVLRNWSSTRSLSVSLPTGSYATQGWARQVGSTLEPQAYQGSAMFKVMSGPVTNVVLLDNQPTAVPAGTPFVFSAFAAGGSGPLEYQFCLFSGGAWSVPQPYSPASSFAWTPGPGDVGTAIVQVWVRSVGSGVAYENWNSSGLLTITP
jgi:hypothetical protein